MPSCLHNHTQHPRLVSACMALTPNHTRTHTHARQRIGSRHAPKSNRCEPTLPATPNADFDVQSSHRRPDVPSYDTHFVMAVPADIANSRSLVARMGPANGAALPTGRNTQNTVPASVMLAVTETLCRPVCVTVKPSSGGVAAVHTARAPPRG